MTRVSPRRKVAYANLSCILSILHHASFATSSKYHPPSCTPSFTRTEDKVAIPQSYRALAPY